MRRTSAIARSAQACAVAASGAHTRTSQREAIALNSSPYSLRTQPRRACRLNRRWFPALGRERLAELLDLRRDHEHAVTLRRVVPEVLLVIVLRAVVHRRRQHLRHDLVVVVRRDLRHRLAGNLLLLRRVGEDHRSILRAHVIALAIELGRVVHHEKNFEDLPIRDAGRIELDAHYFGVTGVAVAYLAVVRAINVAAGVTRLDVNHALEFFVHRFQAPETTAAEGRELIAGARLDGEWTF